MAGPGPEGGVDVGGDAASWAGLFGWKSSTVAYGHRAVAAHSLTGLMEEGKGDDSI